MQRDLEGQAVVVAVDLRTGELHAAPALDPGKHRSPPASTGDPDPGEGIRSEMFETDLHRVFDLPWRPGGYAVAVILQDWISNVVTTELVGGAVAGNAGTARPTTVWPPAARAGDVPDYRRRPDSPEVPDGVGIALAAPTTVPAGGPLIIRGSFRLPLSAGEQLAAGDRPGTAGPRGVLPIALIATGTEDPGPFPVALRVPVDAVDRDLAIGHFAVDLVALRGVPRVAAVYYVHALSVGVAAPPVRISVVSP
jgi:hypothetical protein